MSNDLENKKLIDFTEILKILQEDEKFIKEFAEAATTSFQDFSRDYSTYLLERNETEFRKAGHKIKPVAQMLGIQIILEEYERQKSQFHAEKSKAELQAAADKMTKICDQVLTELEDFNSKN